METSYDLIWDKIRKACNFVYSYDNTKYMKAHSFRNSYVVNSGKAENGKAGSRQATGHSKSMELYYNDNWEVHLMFVQQLETWKKDQEKKFTKPDRYGKNEHVKAMDAFDKPDDNKTDEKEAWKKELDALREI